MSELRLRYVALLTIGISLVGCSRDEYVKFSNAHEEVDSSFNQPLKSMELLSEKTTKNSIDLHGRMTNFWSGKTFILGSVNSEIDHKLYYVCYRGRTDGSFVIDKFDATEVGLVESNSQIPKVVYTSLYADKILYHWSGWKNIVDTVIHGKFLVGGPITRQLIVPTGTIITSYTADIKAIK